MSFTALACKTFVSPQALIPGWPSLDSTLGFVANYLFVWHLSLLHPTILTVHLVVQSGEWLIHRNHYLATVAGIKDLNQGFRSDRSIYAPSAPEALSGRLWMVPCIHHVHYDSAPVHN